ncbi:UDP-N-acetylglucosamine 1-carboxyvinyltransferase [Candidatus Peregrinibacteria bacterium]|jgi:UDP-N-acetylglucosamine 1-carboxyvinyltransferase|nr:UDP-N-acetylglucosamine 1-carboxyvinyltransferase [Candidatus Peregrinibacteria bacterium]MBT5468510.1 UDP-N-acetylglucosamine 1-carboxyvinyltransferase [Candidatus Peregrinibacteria bacterium]MBT7337189.1 UDP-N-acetylglucosamine 1-carboxyvinyltransferase [Candidatus Peregrinibacteria bacterium]
MDIRYRITGGVPLKGDITISGSKNAALPLIAASVLTEGETVLTNVPFLRDIKVILKILDFLGAETSFVDGTVRIRTHNLQSKPIPAEYVSKLRGSIVLLGPLLARFGVVEMSYPGGCVLGKRSVEAHIAALTQLGAEDMSTDEVLHLQGTLKAGTIILPEFSVTASENAIMAAALTPGETRIEMAAAEPHVQAVEYFVQKMGAEVEGIGSHTVIVRGKSTLECKEFRVPADYLEAGFFVIAALVTRGKVRIHDFEYDHLISFLDTIKRMGGEWKYDAAEKVLLVDGELSSLKATRVKTNIFPGFPTDLMSPMGVVMTQATGVSRVFERMFEGRMAYLYELEKMGAHVEMLNAHQALIIGPSQLKSATVTSNDIRAGAAMVIAALCAEGETTITDVRYIERGYDHLDEKLRSLGAKVEKIEIEDPAEVAEKIAKKQMQTAAKNLS